MRAMDGVLEKHFDTVFFFADTTQKYSKSLSVLLAKGTVPFSLLSTLPHHTILHHTTLIRSTDRGSRFRLGSVNDESQ